MVSIIIPVYNGEFTLKKAVSSLFPCEHKVEVIIINDCSTDNTSNVILELSNVYQVISHTNTVNLGRGASRNIGLELVSKESEFIAFMDADDICLNNRLNVQVEYLLRNSEIDVIGTQANLHYNNLGKTSLPLNHTEITRNIVMGIEIIFPSVMLRKRCVKNTAFNAKQRWAQDYVFLLNLVNMGCQFNNLDLVCLDYMPSSGRPTVLKSFYMLRSRAVCISQYKYPRDLAWLIIFVCYVIARQIRILK